MTVAGDPVQLTPMEYDLLVELSSSAGRVVRHADLLASGMESKETG